MRLHREGTVSIIIAIVIGSALAYVGTLFNDYVIVQWLFNLLAAYILFTVVYFFREPNRTYTAIEDMAYSPVDGKVVAIEKVFEGEYLKEDRIQVSVFMSPLNVHINWSPIGGIVKYFKYHPGKFLVAWHPKSSTQNERTTTVVEDKKGRSLLYRQIAGAVARRIVHYKPEGSKVDVCEEFGFIKFGSRVDVFLPLDAEIKVKIDDKVQGRRSILAELK